MALNFMELCGWGRIDSKTEKERIVEAQRIADDTAAKFAKPFFVKSQLESGQGKCARLFKVVEKVTSKKIRVDPQLTGDCVAAAMRQILQIRLCTAILKDAIEDYRWVFHPFHYATGRVLVGKNRLKGSAGSVGGWQAQAIGEYGFVAADDVGLEYTRDLADAWGDDRKSQGKSFRDFLPLAEHSKVITWSRTNGWNESRDSLYHGYPLHLCSSCGYTMKPGRDGFHKPSGTWPHALTVFGYWENVKTPCVAIGNTWGDVHGVVKDPETGEPLPPGTLLVRLEDFLRYHLTSQSECIAICETDGFEAQVDWEKLGGKK